MENITAIGLAGGSGSGKTTLTKRLVERFGALVTVVRHDDYYRAYQDIPLHERVKLNYDHPSAFETELLVAQLKELKQGHSMISPVYDYSNHTRSSKTRQIQPTKVIIVEGILVFESKELCDLMDIKIYVDTDADVRLIRRIRRDVKKRKRSLDSVLEQYVSTVKPMHEQFVEPSKKNADIIVPTGGYNKVALDMIIRHIEEALKK
ncbi:MAG TPA: uridine kinase [Clostridiales bacterium]|jgi:uridine kinase|nr:uridine kinase [Clostridiales bacterium]HCG36705.1 uridine kinase [Clostridiales bacterium]